MTNSIIFLLLRTGLAIVRKQHWGSAGVAFKQEVISASVLNALFHVFLNECVDCGYMNIRETTSKEIKEASSSSTGRGSPLHWKSSFGRYFLLNACQETYKDEEREERKEKKEERRLASESQGCLPITE